MKIVHQGIQYEISEKYSHKDMTGWDLSREGNMNGLVIYNSCLSNETPDAQILPQGLYGATFIACNLDNVLVPEGNTVIDCTTRRYEVQNDLEDWVVDSESRTPIEPLNRKHFESLGLSIDPKSIPLEKMTKTVTAEKLEELGKQKALEDAIALVSELSMEVK